MSGSVDERIVSLKFDNAQFENGVKKSLDSLTQLNKGLKLEGATKGLNDVNAAVGKFSMAGMAKSISDIASKFSGLSVIAITALTNIVNKVVNAGLQMAKSLTVQPITDGLHEYETQLNSIQTILANTGLTGQAGLNKVNAALNNLNHYSDLTIYNFSEMARNIGTFTAAGVDLNTSVNAIKGIANLAALSGSNADQASTAMYQLSQALSTGTVKLQDWNSVVNAGMGGKVFQESLKETARAHGVAVDKIIKDEGSFRDSLQTGWLTSSILTETLSKFTGDLNARQLKTMGYTDKQIVGILKMGQTAKNAATKVKTFTQLIGTLQEAAGSGWATTWSLIFGNFNEAEDLFTGVNNVLSGFIQSSANARNKVLSDWKELGGRTVLIKAIGEAFTGVLSILKPVKDAFREIFPAKTGQDLFNMTKSFEQFAAGLKIGAQTADELKRTFAGVFAIFGIGFDIVKEVVKTLLGLFKTAGDGAGSFLQVTANIGDFLVNLKKAIEQGDGLTNFFKTIGAILAKPIQLLEQFAGAVKDAFSSGDSGALNKFQQRFQPVAAVGSLISKAWSHVGDVMKAVFKVIEPIAGKISDEFSKVIDALTNSLSTGDFSSVLDAINTGLFGGLVLIIKKFLKNGLSGLDVSGGIIGKIKDTFGALTDTLSIMQAQLKASTLIKIAGAIGVLVLAVVALSLIDSGSLTKSLTAISVMFVQLAAALVVLEKATGSVGFIKLPVVAASLILLATAIDILALAVAGLAQLDWNQLAKGLTGVAVLIGLLVVATKGISGNAGGMIAGSAGLILMAGAIKILASAVEDLSGMSWAEMAKGLVGVGVLLGSLALFSKFASADAGGVLAGAGIVLLAGGIKILASALKDISDLSWEELAQGMVGLAGGLVLIGTALNLIPPSSVLSAAAILVVAAGLEIFTDAFGRMANMSWGEIAKGLTVLGVSLTLISIAMNTMIAALPGAAALLIVSAALAIFEPVLKGFAGMSWGDIAKGLITLAAALTIIGVAGLLLAPVVPVLIGLGAAIALLGLGMLAAGAGVLAFSIGLTALSVAGAAAVAVVVGSIGALIGLIPKVMTGIALGIAAFAKTIATAAPAMFQAMTVVITSLLNAIVKLAPKVISTLLSLLTSLLNALANAIPKMVSAGVKIILGILTGMSNNIGKIVTVATNLIVNFLNAISANQGRVTNAGVKMIISFINGVANAIRSNSKAMGAAGANLGSAIVEGMVRGLAGGIGQITSEARSIAKSALNAAKNALGIHSPSKEFEKVGAFSTEGMANGLTKTSGTVTDAAEVVGKAAILAMRKSIGNIAEILHGDLDLNPVITPVVDITEARKTAAQLAALIKAQVVPVTSTTSTTAAKVAQAATAARAQAQYDLIHPPGGLTPGQTTVRDIIYNQTNNSPKALSNAEIYRLTKNQLSIVKGQLP